MYRLSILRIGQSRPSPTQTLITEYQKRLQPYAKIEIITLKETSFQGPEDRERVLQEEEARLLSAIPEGAFVVVLEAQGATYASEAFAKQLATWSEHHTRHIVFLLGGPLGLSDAIKQRADALLAFSPMTFPHDIAGVLLMEQLYRAMTIEHGKTYHY